MKGKDDLAAPRPQPHQLRRDALLGQRHCIGPACEGASGSASASHSALSPIPAISIPSVMPCPFAHSLYPPPSAARKLAKRPRPPRREPPSTGKDRAHVHPLPGWPDIWADLYDAMDVDRRPHLDFYCSLVTPRQRASSTGLRHGSITLTIAAGLPPGARVVGVDLSHRLVEICRTRAPRHEWAVGKIAAPPRDRTLRPRGDLLSHPAGHAHRRRPAALPRCRGRAPVAGRAFRLRHLPPEPAWLASVTPDPAIARQFTDAQGRTVDVVETRRPLRHRNPYPVGHLDPARCGDRAPIPVEPIVQRLRQYAPETSLPPLARAGLAIDTVWGDLDRSPFTEGSKRQVYLCRKA